MGRRIRSVATLPCRPCGGEELEVCGGGQDIDRPKPSDVRATAPQGRDVRGRNCRRGRAAASTVVIRRERGSLRSLAAAGITVSGWPRHPAVRTAVPLGRGVTAVAQRLRTRPRDRSRRSGAEMAGEEATRQRERRQAIAAERSIGGKRGGDTTTADATSRQQQRSERYF